MFADHDDGWSFFFKDIARARILFELLDASEPERTRVEAAARDRLDGRRAARVCVDLHAVGGDADTLLAAVEDAVLAVPGATPAVVLLTPDQYRRLPITYADRRGTLDLVKVTTDEEAATAVERCPRALVVSPLPPRDAAGAPALERWAALEFQRGAVEMEPRDAVARFLATGALDALPTVADAHRLDALGTLPAAAAPGARGPALRRRLVSLADGTADGRPETRLGEALAWGIVAASTDDERVHAALAAAGLVEEAVTREALDRALARAGRRPGAGVYEVDGAWHLLNAEPPATLAGHPRVQVHRVEARPTALRRLHEHVRDRTALEMSLDARLDGAIAALDPEGREAEAFAHARAWLLHGGLAPVADRPCPDAIGALTRLLAHDAPPAEVRMERRASELPEGVQEPDVVVCAMADWEALSNSVWEQVPLSGDAFWLGRDAWWVAAWGAEVKTIGSFCRTDYWGSRARDPGDGAWEKPLYIGRAAVPDSLPTDDDDAWLDAFEAKGPEEPRENLRHLLASARSAEVERTAVGIIEYEQRSRGARVSVARARERASEELSMDVGHDLRHVTLAVSTFSHPDWADLDVHLALAWLALREALATRAPLRLHDGRYLLPIQPGVFAEITTVEAPTSAPLRAAFSFAYAAGESRAEAHLDEGWETKLVESLGGKGVWFGSSPLLVRLNQLGVEVPAELHLVGEGVAATVRFRAEPYGLAGFTGGPKVG